MRRSYSVNAEELLRECGRVTSEYYATLTGDVNEIRPGQTDANAIRPGLATVSGNRWFAEFINFRKNSVADHLFQLYGPF